MLGKRRSTNQLDYVDLIINYLKKKRIGYFDREYTVFIFEASNLFVAKKLG